MSLRRPFAAVLQLLRNHQGLTQRAIAGRITQNHISQLETAKTTATVDVAQDLASALNVEATTFFAMMIAAEQQRSPREILMSAIAELEGLGFADEVLPDAPRQLEAPRVVASREKWRAIQALKAKGYSQSDIARELGYAKGTVWRLWNDEPGE